MGFFDDNKPKVTKDEWKKARQELYSRDIKTDKLNRVEKVINSNLKANNDGSNISTEELEKSIEYMKKHKNNVNLSDSDISKIEETLKKKL